MSPELFKKAKVMAVLASLLASFFLGSIMESKHPLMLLELLKFGGKARENKLVDILDQVSFDSFVIEEENFHDSCFVVEAMLREKLPETSVPDTLSIASNLRVLVGTYRNGKKSLSCPKGATVREVLQEFASTWDAAVLLDGNFILFVEVFDQSRFDHAIKLSK